MTVNTLLSFSGSITRYLGNHVLTKSRLQLQPPFLAGAEHSVPVCFPGAVASNLRRGRIISGGDLRVCRGPVRVVCERLNTRPIRLCKEKIIRKLAKADEQSRYPGQDHELLLMFPKAPQRRQNRAVDVW